MGVGVGINIPAVGPYGAIVSLLFAIIAVSAAMIILYMVGKSQMPEGEVWIRILGVRVRWGPAKQNKQISKSGSEPEEADEEDKKSESPT